MGRGCPSAQGTSPFKHGTLPNHLGVVRVDALDLGHALCPELGGPRRVGELLLVHLQLRHRDHLCQGIGL